jgi:hypothetical protein
MSARLLSAIVLGVSSVWGAAQADTVVLLPDPTRPPNAVRSSQIGKAQGSSAPLAAPATPTDAAAAPAERQPAPPLAPRRLQSIRTTGPGTGLALIDGVLVGVGERVGQATVVSMDSDTVVLRSAQGEVRLSLTPTVNKTPPGAVSSAASRGGKER